MDPIALSTVIADRAAALGFDLVGIAPVGPSPDYARFEQWLAAGYDGAMAYLARQAVARADPRVATPDARSVIMLGANYGAQRLPVTLRTDPSRGLFASYAWGQDYHDVLKPLLFELDATVRAASGRAALGRVYVDSGPLLERSWAQQAGLGFIGKNTCLIAPRLGSWLFLAALVIPEEAASVACHVPHDRAQTLSPSLPLSPSPSHPLPLSPPLTPAPSLPLSPTCGACTRCLDICPTAAFPAPHVLDARLCISYLTIELKGPIPRALRPALGNWVFGCDLCQDVCPYNRRFARPSRLAALQARPELLAPKLLDLLALDEDGFRRRFRGSPVLRSKRRGLLRNVCVALGNWGDPAAAPGLVDALHDVEPLVRGHAAWALGQIGTLPARQALQAAAATETDRYVLEELRLALSR